MFAEVDIAAVGAALADKARASMLVTLMAGESVSAGDLGGRCGVSASGTSNHLRRLENEGLVAVERVGRNRFVRLASADVAEALEALARIAPPQASRTFRQAEAAQALQRARICYDHLAGKLGVSLTEALLEREILLVDRDEFELAREGESWFARHAIDVSVLRERRRSFARGCADWTERRPHVAGSLGAALASLFFSRQWIARQRGSRAVRISAAGAEWLDRELGIKTFE